ncbi:MAG: ATP-grasp domain-containing protein [Sorangiineae bacterium]|nr:ATP-grasp domain-containing protein [Polyangiaceae bacterium]MEB2321368.1 ATP-grasp domain-containing protein [Sorangiineae bacterium]
MFKKVLVANRGEIACRVLRTCERMGIRTVAVFSDADARAPHISLADEAINVGPPPVKDSYLSIENLIAAVKQTGADAVHPGYGLLSEKRAFAEAVAGAGATFVGPPPEALEAFGDKIKARAVGRSVGVMPPPGSEGPIDPNDLVRLDAEAARIGYPVLIKAAGGGGGIGMQVVTEPGQIERAARSCSDRGRAAFGDERVYLERYLAEPRHIEVQIFRDAHGHTVALGERECSVQRRHQKIIEESPSPAAFFAEPGKRERLWADAVRVVDAVGYLGAGTVEFVADHSGALYFLEVNARLQVEHPVTELVTGLDLVELQLRVAAGEPLPEAARAPRFSGHAVEARVYAEDPSKLFVPQPGHIEELAWPSGLPGVRIDAGVAQGNEVTPFYDPMLAKVIAHGDSREEAIRRLDAALAGTRLVLMGPKGPRATNLGFLRRVLADPRFAEGRYDTRLAEELARAKG